MGRHKKPPLTDLSWKEAIIEVLRKADDAMHSAEIADQISERGLYKDLGATPRNTIAAIISQSLKNDSPSPFEKVQRGVFQLREAQKQSKNGAAENIDDNEKKSGVIKAIGMFWDRNRVSWSQSPDILGSEAPNSKPINFCN